MAVTGWVMNLWTLHIWQRALEELFKLRILRCEEYPESLSRRVQCNHNGPCKKDPQELQWEEEEATWGQRQRQGWGHLQTHQGPQSKEPRQSREGRDQARQQTPLSLQREPVLLRAWPEPEETEVRPLASRTVTQSIDVVVSHWVCVNLFQ